RPKSRKRAAAARASGNSRPGKSVKTPHAAADNSRGEKLGGFEVAELKRLIRLVQKTGIGELEVTSGGRTVRIAATANAGIEAITIPVSAPSPAAAPPVASAGGSAATDHLTPIVSPMVGT